MVIIDKEGARLKGWPALPMPCTKITVVKDGALWPFVVLFLFAVLRMELKFS